MKVSYHDIFLFLKCYKSGMASTLLETTNPRCVNGNQVRSPSARFQATKLATKKHPEN